MSEKRLCKNVAKYRRAQIKNLQWTPVIITDSKGKYLRSSDSRVDSTDIKLQWLGRSGFTTTDAVRFLTHDKLRSLLRHHGQISLYVFLGTCDFTSKGSKRLIKLNKPTSQSLHKYFSNLETLKLRCTSKRVRITFFQCPYYSIQRWNKAQGHKTPSIFKDDDKTLTKVINRANAYIDRLNCEASTYTPQLNQDFQRSRKHSGRKPRYSLRFNLLKDGIHPKPKLARSWLSSIKRKVNRDCARL